MLTIIELAYQLQTVFLQSLYYAKTGAYMAATWIAAQPAASVIAIAIGLILASIILRKLVSKIIKKLQSTRKDTKSTPTPANTDVKIFNSALTYNSTQPYFELDENSPDNTRAAVYLLRWTIKNDQGYMYMTEDPMSEQYTEQDGKNTLDNEHYLCFDDTIERMLLSSYTELKAILSSNKLALSDQTDWLMVSAYISVGKVDLLPNGLKEYIDYIESTDHTIAENHKEIFYASLYASDQKDEYLAEFKKYIVIFEEQDLSQKAINSAQANAMTCKVVLSTPDSDPLRSISIDTQLSCEFEDPTQVTVKNMLTFGASDRDDLDVSKKEEAITVANIMLDTAKKGLTSAFASMRFHKRHQASAKELVEQIKALATKTELHKESLSKLATIDNPNSNSSMKSIPEIAKVIESIRNATTESQKQLESLWKGVLDRLSSVLNQYADESSLEYNLKSVTSSTLAPNGTSTMDMSFMGDENSLLQSLNMPECRRKHLDMVSEANELLKSATHPTT